MQRKYTVSFYIPGESTAALNIRWNVPDHCQLVHISASTSDAALLTSMDIGDENDAGLHVEDMVIGTVANQVYELPVLSGAYGNTGSFMEFETGQFPRIRDGDTVVIAVDTDQNNADDITIVLTFLEG